MSHRNAPSTEDTAFNSSRYCLSPNGVPVTGANHSSFCHKDSWHLEIMRRTAPPPAHSHTLLCYFHLCNSKKTKERLMLYGCVWCQEKQPSAVEISGVKLAWTIVHQAAELAHELTEKTQSWATKLPYEKLWMEYKHPFMCSPAWYITSGLPFTHVQLE